MKEKLLQAEQQLVEFEHNLALKNMKIRGVRAELCRAWIKLDEASLSVVKVERCIDDLREEVYKVASAWSELEEQVSEIVESIKATS